MRPTARKSITWTLAAAIASLALVFSQSSAVAQDDDTQIQPFLRKELTKLVGDKPALVLVHGETYTAAKDAVKAVGMKSAIPFRRIGVLGAVGTKDQIRAVAEQPGVTYVEGNQPIKFFQSTSNTATRGAQAAAELTGANGTKLTGEGVSIAVIDSGVDPTHPYFGKPWDSAVVANLKSLCLPLIEALCHVQRVPNVVDTDTLSVGGHGTHVSGIAAGRPTKLHSGEKLQGAAPGAKIVSISTGAVILIVGADAALNWVLENHEQPCGAAVSAEKCPPIKVINNSYGPSGGGEFDPQSATVKLQRKLAQEGVVTVWANGNDGGDGSANMSNPPGMDSTGGIISVASYNDNDTGTRNGTVSDFSSRGKAGDRSTYPDISAPGQAITSSCRPYLIICATGLDVKNGPGLLDIATFNTIDGTSMAAPHIAGIVAQLFQAKPNATPAQIERAIVSTAHKYRDGADYEPGANGSTSFDKGHGLVDVMAAVAALR